MFAHDGRPFLSYESRAWLLGPDGEVLRPAARETGFWRPQPDGELEVLITHATGITEIFYGRARTLTSWETGDRRAWCARRRRRTSCRPTGCTGSSTGGDLAYVDERAMMGQPQQPHLSAQLRRIAG